MGPARPMKKSEQPFLPDLMSYRKIEATFCLLDQNLHKNKACPSHLKNCATLRRPVVSDVF